MTAVAPPQPVPIYSGFDYLTVDAQRRRVYAAHTESNALLIVDADSGNVLGQVKVGNLHGVAVDPASATCIPETVPTKRYRKWTQRA